MIKFKIEADGKEKEMTIIMSKKQLKALFFTIGVGLIIKQFKLSGKVKSIAEKCYLYGMRDTLEYMHNIK